MENSKQCGYCGKTFGTTYLLQTHMQVHSETKILLKSAKLDKKGLGSSFWKGSLQDDSTPIIFTDPVFFELRLNVPALVRKKDETKTQRRRPVSKPAEKPQVKSIPGDEKASAGIDQCKNQPKRETRQSKRSPTEIPQNLQKNKEI